MQSELDIANRWCHDNGLIINAVKTKLMHIRPRHLVQAPISLTFHNTECLHKNANKPNIICSNCKTTIELVETYKYLGVLVDMNFKWKPHIENLQNKLRKSAYMLNQLSYCSTYSVLRQVYFSIVESHIRHGISAWGSSTHCRALQNAQNRLLKILQINSHNTGTTNFHPTDNAHNNTLQYPPNLNYNYTTRQRSTQNTNATNLNATNQRNSERQTTTQQTDAHNSLAKNVYVLNVKSIYHMTLVNEFYRDTRFLNILDHEYNTRRRAQRKYKVQKFQNEYGRSTLGVALPSIFNKISNNIINECNILKRKKLLKKYFISSQ